jgi:hypothetical protein
METSVSFLAAAVSTLAILLPNAVLSAPETRPVPPAFPSFKAHLVDRFPGGYKVAAVDIDRDGKPDVMALATEPSCLAWYRNPGWEKHVLTSRTKEYIDLAPYDIDGDGRIDLAIADEFGMSRTSSGGLLHWLKCPPDPAGDWPVYAIGAEPTSHRIRWADLNGDGRKELVNAPLMGRDAKAPLWNVGVRLTWYAIPDPPAAEPWKPVIIDNQLTVLHGITVVDWDGDGRDDILTASFEGIHLFQPHGRGNEVSWSKTKIGQGEQSNPARRGSSEIALGRLATGPGRFLAAVEPWHGDKVVVYTPGTDAGALWQRTVIDATFHEGHALTCADLDGDGADEIIAGYRGRGQSLYIYDCTDSVGGRWERIALDEGDMAASGLDVADLNGDGRLDVVCIGTATSNIKWYENLGPAQ